MPSQKVTEKKIIASVEQIESRIFVIRGQRSCWMPTWQSYMGWIPRC